MCKWLIDLFLITDKQIDCGRICSQAQRLQEEQRGAEECGQSAGQRRGKTGQGTDENVLKKNEMIKVNDVHFNSV